MNLDSQTEKEIFQQHTPLVAALVRQFTDSAPAVFSREQLHSFGLVALLNAVRERKRFGSVAFESFARTYIQDALLAEVRRQKNWFAGATENSTSHFARV
jgi:DNA-directed RNA polymerase specialized sigma subunit